MTRRAAPKTNTVVRSTEDALRAERRAAPKPARVPSGDRPTYPSDEGLS